MAENKPATSKTETKIDSKQSGNCTSNPVCPVCSGATFEIRGKLQCSRCHTICETCCEGGRQ